MIDFDLAYFGFRPFSYQIRSMHHNDTCSLTNLGLSPVDLSVELLMAGIKVDRSRIRF